MILTKSNLIWRTRITNTTDGAQTVLWPWCFILLGKAASVALIIYGANQEAPAAGWIVAAGVLLLLFFFITNTGFMLLEPNEARVLTFFGEYRGSFYKTGFWWVNFFMSKKELSLRARNLNAEPIKVNDKTGNPIMIGLVLVWRLKRDEIYRAVFDIDVAANAHGQVSQSDRMHMLESFVAVQSDAALRQVAGLYAYDDNGADSGEVTLRSNSDEINVVLEQRLSERLAIAGIEVVEARINYLAYAPRDCGRDAAPPAGRGHHSRPQEDCGGSGLHGEDGVGPSLGG